MGGDAEVLYLRVYMVYCVRVRLAKSRLGLYFFYTELTMCLCVSRVSKLFNIKPYALIETRQLYRITKRLAAVCAKVRNRRVPCVLRGGRGGVSTRGPSRVR